MVNYLAGLQYFGEAAQAAALVAALPANATTEQKLALAEQLAVLFAPKLANDPNFQSAEQFSAELAAAEAGQTSNLAAIKFQSNNVKLQLNMSVGPAQ